MVKEDIIVTEQKEYKTDCEIVWVKIEIVGTRPLFIAAYYRPKEGDSYSADEFHRSLEMVTGLPLTFKFRKSRIPTFEIWKSHCFFFLEVPLFSVIWSRYGGLLNLL